MAQTAAIELGDAYANRVEALSDVTASSIVSVLEAVLAGVEPTADPGTLQPAMVVFVGRGAGVLELGQGSAIDAASGFARASSSSLGHEVVLPGASDMIGADAYGRTVGQLLGGVPAKVYVALAQGRPFAEALEAGRQAARAIATTVVRDTAREALHRIMRDSPAVLGWRWVSRGTCSACLAADDGSDRPDAEPQKVHPYCRCSADPIFSDPVPPEVDRATTPVSWYDALTEEEFKAGEFYKGTGYRSMNPALRGQGEISPLMEKRIRLLDSALQKGALKKDQTLFRMAPQKALGDLKPGVEFVDDGFISTSLKRSFAGDYRHKKVVQILEIRAKAGQAGGWADQLWRLGKGPKGGPWLNNMLKENEFILPRGTRFRVVRVWQGNDGLRHVEVEIV